MLPPAELARPELRGTVGRPVGGVEVEVRDPEGRPVPTGAAGEIWVRGPQVMRGYHHAPERTARVLRDGWYATGDLGSLDAAGYLSVHGRRDDLLVANTHLAPQDLEDVLSEHPAVSVAAVYGTVDGDGQVALGVAVVPVPGAPGPGADEVTAWPVERRGRGAAPRVVRTLDALPARGSGKPDRDALRRSDTPQAPPG